MCVSDGGGGVYRVWPRVLTHVEEKDEEAVEEEEEEEEEKEKK